MAHPDRERARQALQVYTGNIGATWTKSMHHDPHSIFYKYYFHELATCVSSNVVNREQQNISTKHTVGTKRVNTSYLRKASITSTRYVMHALTHTTCTDLLHPCLRGLLELLLFFLQHLKDELGTGQLLVVLLWLP